MRFRSLTLAVTLRCTARCAHCATNGSPDKRAAIDPELALEAAGEAAKLGLAIVVSGGEPLLMPDLVCRVARRARPHGVSVGVYSNAFWAKTRPQARRVIRRLAQAGVDILLLSTGTFHLPYVPAEAVRNAAEAAVEAGLRCEVAVAAPADAEVPSEVAACLRALPGIVVNAHPVARTGRAGRLPESTFRSGVFDRPCGVLGQLALMPDAHVYGCCASSVNFGRDSVLCAGRLGPAGLDELLDRLDRVPLLEDIQTRGPLLATVREAIRNPGFSFQLAPRYSDVCDECRTVCEAYALACREGIVGTPHE